MSYARILRFLVIIAAVITALAFAETCIETDGKTCCLCNDFWICDITTCITFTDDQILQLASNTIVRMSEKVIAEERK